MVKHNHSLILNIFLIYQQNQNLNDCFLIFLSNHPCAHLFCSGMIQHNAPYHWHFLKINSYKHNLYLINPTFPYLPLYAQLHALQSHILYFFHLIISKHHFSYILSPYFFIIFVTLYIKTRSRNFC